MDAKVLRAAVSAALRVTVSTTLIGCGGSASTDTGRPSSSSPAVKDTPASAGRPPITEAEPAHSPSAQPVTSTGGSASETETETETPSAGTAAGGVEMGGMAAIAGAGGDEASAGAPAEVCRAAAQACLTQLEQTTPEPPSAADKACCDTVIATLEELWQTTPRDACFATIETRFRGAVRAECCADKSTWVYRACTPWGPPVPPELSREALQRWSSAA
jgi:hypothetical protein